MAGDPKNLRHYVPFTTREWGYVHLDCKIVYILQHGSLQDQGSLLPLIKSTLCTASSKVKTFGHDYLRPQTAQLVYEQKIVEH